MSRCGSSGSSGLSPWKDAGTVNSMLDRDQEPWTTPRGPGTWLPILRENLIYTGISTDPLYAVGPMGSNARVTRLSGTDFNLPHLAVSPSAAYGIVSNASLIVGSSLGPYGTIRPTSWSGSGTTYTAKDVGGSLRTNWAGSAFGANLENQVVGEMQVVYDGGWSGFVAFRSKASASVQALAFDSDKGNNCDILRAPGTTGGYNLTERAIAANRSGTTVGRYTTAGGFRIGVSWPSATAASDAVATELGPWKSKVGTNEDEHSVANGINDLGWIVGWSGSSAAVPDRAVIKWVATDEPMDWIDLNDAHFVSGSTAWVLKEATAVNNSGQIVGKGTHYGSARAFILVPRTTGN